jgi:hypothetical protein
LSNRVAAVGSSSETRVIRCCNHKAHHLNGFSPFHTLTIKAYKMGWTYRGYGAGPD